MPGREIGRAKLVELGSVDANGVSVDGRAFEAASQGDNEAGVNATRQIGAHRHVRPQSLFNGLQHDLLKVIHQTARVPSRILFAAVRKIHLPVGVLFDNGRCPSASRDDLQVTGGRQEVDPFEARHRRRQGGESEDAIDPAQVGPGGHHSRGQQCLDLGGEEKPVALACPVERAYAKAVPAENKFLLAFVPQGDGELAPQADEHFFLTLFPQVRNDFGVAVGDEAMPARLQFVSLFDVIEQFAVENDRYAPVFIGDRLLAIRQPDDTEPSRGQFHPASPEISLLVRAAMHQSFSHLFDDSLGHRPLPQQINDACNAAHSVFTLYSLGLACQASVLSNFSPS